MAPRPRTGGGKEGSPDARKLFTDSGTAGRRTRERPEKSSKVYFRRLREGSRPSRPGPATTPRLLISGPAPSLWGCPTSRQPHFPAPPTGSTAQSQAGPREFLRRWGGKGRARGSTCVMGGAWPAGCRRARDRHGSRDWVGEKQSQVRAADFSAVCADVAMPTAAVAHNTWWGRRMRLTETFSPVCKGEV